MREIPLTKGQVAIVDDADYELIAQWKWRAGWSVNTQTFYACRNYQINKRIFNVMMHRQILNLQRDDKQVVDHINHDTLDNRRSNLRVCTRSQNQWNRLRAANNTSGHTGVCWLKNYRKWRAQFQVNKKLQFVGHFDSLEEAVVAYKNAIAEIRGEFACQESA